ncbi:hypothetical protein BDW72DRAFT_94007 [Aspergillus terricola var. indicus]
MRFALWNCWFTARSDWSSYSLVHALHTEQWTRQLPGRQAHAPGACPQTNTAFAMRLGTSYFYHRSMLSKSKVTAVRAKPSINILCLHQVDRRGYRWSMGADQQRAIATGAGPPCLGRQTRSLGSRSEEKQETQ